MKFEIPFDELVYRKQIDLSFRTSWEKSLKNAKIEGLYALGFILFGIAMILGKANFGYAVLVFGLFLIIHAIVGLNKYLKAKKTTAQLAEKNINLLKEKPISNWEFENDYFRFEFFGGDYKMYWDNFKYFNVIESTLFFGVDEYSDHFILSECEVGKENFIKIAELVKDKTSC